MLSPFWEQKPTPLSQGVYNLVGKSNITYADQCIRTLSVTCPTELFQTAHLLLPYRNAEQNIRKTLENTQLSSKTRKENSQIPEIAQELKARIRS